MSGPKTSRYTLTPEQRRILAEQRKLERRKAVATEKIKQTQKRLLQIGGMFNTEKQIASELSARTGDDHGFAARMTGLETLIAPMQPLIAHTDYDAVAAVEEVAAAVSACHKQAEALAAKLSAIAATNEVTLKATLSEAIDKGFTTSFADIPAPPPNETASLRLQTAQQLAQLQKHTALPPAQQRALRAAAAKLEAISDDAFLKNFIAVTVQPLLKQSNQLIAEAIACQAEFDPLYAEYTALCALRGSTAQEYSCSRASIQALQGEIDRIQTAMAEEDEQAYISDCLDEAMTEMGYTVLGTRAVTKRNGKRFRNELYTYGDGTAVNITYASDGKIAMELGGLDTSDRTPTAQEADKLCDAMEQFCADFKELEVRLLAKGVILADRVSLLPPDAEYAQIINTADYAMQTEAQSGHRRRQKRPKAKEKRTMQH